MTAAPWEHRSAYELQGHGSRIFHCKPVFFRPWLTQHWGNSLNVICFASRMKACCLSYCCYCCGKAFQPKTIFQKTVHCWRKAGHETGDKNQYRGHEGRLLTGFLLTVHSACVLTASKSGSSEAALPRVSGLFPSWIKKMFCSITCSSAYQSYEALPAALPVTWGGRGLLGPPAV